MATKIRLQRHGRKGRPIFTIVAADARAKRDGKYIENLGQYNPNTNPATIDLDFDRALDWIMKGAEPTNTARAILKYKGVMMKKHLLLGVQKGALTAEQAEARFETWSADKAGRIDSKIENLNTSAKTAKEERLKAEAAVKDARAAAIAAKNVPEPVAEEVAEVAVEEAPAAEVAVEEAPAAEVACRGSSRCRGCRGGSSRCRGCRRGSSRCRGCRRGSSRCRSGSGRGILRGARFRGSTC
jgi:small subunit ribosomal protein S16